MTFVDNGDVKKVGMPIRGIKFSAPAPFDQPRKSKNFKVLGESDPRWNEI